MEMEIDGPDESTARRERESSGPREAERKRTGKDSRASADCTPRHYGQWLERAKKATFAGTALVRKTRKTVLS